MRNRKWEAIHELYNRMERLYGRSLYKPDDALFGDEAESRKAQPAADAPEREYTLDELIEFRVELRIQLDRLKIVFGEEHSESDVYMILFALVAHIDEIVQNNILKSLDISWPLLQKELFQIENAGDVYYEILDSILQKPQTNPFIYEVYYFCLRYGFRGRHDNNPASVQEYIKKLRDRIQARSDREFEEDDEAAGHIRKIMAPHWYYVIGAGIVAATYLILLIVARNM